MGTSYSYYRCYIFFFLMIAVSTQLRFMAEGGAICKLLEAAKIGNAAYGEEKVQLQARIGSRPPRCKMRCGSCGHCVAVQIPAVPQERIGRRHSEVATSSSGEGVFSYKPMNWKCKCGDMIFNP